MNKLKLCDCGKWWGEDHTFEKWEKVSEGPLMEYSLRAPDLGNRTIGLIIRQKRTCAVCGYIEYDQKILKS